MFSSFIAVLHLTVTVGSCLIMSITHTLKWVWGSPWYRFYTVSDYCTLLNLEGAVMAAIIIMLDYDNNLMIKKTLYKMVQIKM
jgi:hypothetical protein